MVWYTLVRACVETYKPKCNLAPIFIRDLLQDSKVLKAALEEVLHADKDNWLRFLQWLLAGMYFVTRAPFRGLKGSEKRALEFGAEAAAAVTCGEC